MERYFKLEDGSLVNVIDHCKEQILKHSGLKVYIATDSQVTKKMIFFATVIVFRYGSNGAHYIYFLEKKDKRSMSIYERLFDEAARTIKTAEMVRAEIPLKIEALEFDYNNVKKTKSSGLITTIRGWAMGLGYRAVFKGDQMIASKAGDHICRKKCD